jgi:hypothetical protein
MNRDSWVAEMIVHQLSGFESRYRVPLCSKFPWILCSAGAVFCPGYGQPGCGAGCGCCSQCFPGLNSTVPLCSLTGKCSAYGFFSYIIIEYVRACELMTNTKLCVPLLVLCLHTVEIGKLSYKSFRVGDTLLPNTDRICSGKFALFETFCLDRFCPFTEYKL